MWVTQTYLAMVEPDAKVFIYYLFEEYNDQNEFTRKIQTHLERMGEVHGGDVSLFMPNPKYADRVEAEMREIRPLWELIYPALPALLVSTAPMRDLDGNTDKCICIPFSGESASDVAKTIEKVRKLTYETVCAKHREISAPDKKGYWNRIGDAVELKPGLFGIRLDLRKLPWKKA